MAETIVTLFILSWITTAGLAGAAAHGQDRSVAGWLILGLLFPPAFLFAVLMGKPKDHRS